jgi:hypothetical protein
LRNGAPKLSKYSFILIVALQLERFTFLKAAIEILVSPRASPVGQGSKLMPSL